MINIKQGMLLALFFISFNGLSQSFECGELLSDTRDGKKYNTVKIGKQCWMAENLNIGEIVADHKQLNNGIIEKTCFDNREENCEKLGGQYTYFEALQYNEKLTGGICPDGWHIPEMKEWQTLIHYLGEDSAGYKLKNEKTAEIPWDGSNSTQFSALPAGVGCQGTFGRLNQWASFWASSSYNDKWAWSVQLDNYWYPMPPKSHKLIETYFYKKENAFSIRCIKNK